tara:strand:+ start:255 stop:749 length:495 start_codon:yes stop_codon:yes gene_type:complete
MRLCLILLAFSIVVMGAGSIVAQELSIQPYDFGASSQSSGTVSSPRTPSSEPPPPQRPVPLSSGTNYVEEGYGEPGVSQGWSGPDSENSGMLPYEPDPKEPSGDKKCGAYPQWIGREVREQVVMATGKTYRILKPNAIVTQDYSADRINVYVDDKNIVIDVRCG